MRILLVVCLLAGCTETNAPAFPFGEWQLQRANSLALPATLLAGQPGDCSVVLRTGVISIRNDGTYAGTLAYGQADGTCAAQQVEQGTFTATTSAITFTHGLITYSMPVASDGTMSHSAAGVSYVYARR